MLGQMMNQPLLISSQIRHAARYHADGEIVSVETAGGVHRTNWGEVERRARRLGSALQSLGLQHSDRVATLAWNSDRHLALYYGVSGSGAVMHTVNPRLFAEQIVYIINYGMPYDGTAMLLQLGGWYWIIVLVEVLFWIMFGTLILQKIRSRGDQQPTASPI